jgi:xanthine dehydrogenase accessory factor
MEHDTSGAICGGEAEVLVDADPSRHQKALEELVKALSEKKDGFLLTGVTRKHEGGRTIVRYWIKGEHPQDLPALFEPEFKNVIRDHLQQAMKDGYTEIDLHATPNQQFELAFLEYIHPRPRLVIAGAGHIGKALAHIGSLLNFEVTVSDDRPEFANRDNIPDADHLVVGPPGQVLKKLQPGTGTYIVIATRGHHQDGEALRACIGSGADYIGMMGSRHKVQTMKNQFLEEGWATPEQWSDLHAPVGLDIGSKTVQEIAISIAAQLVEVLNRKNRPHAK